MQRTVKISGIEQDEKKITVLENTGQTRKDGTPKPNKYTIWIKKQDGSPTKAFMSFSAKKPSVGDEINVEVKEEQKEYNGFPYVQRTVMYFLEGNAGFAKPQQSQPVGLEVQFNQLASRVSELEKAVKSLITPDKYQFNIHKDKQEETNEDVEQISLEDIPF